MAGRPFRLDTKRTLVIALGLIDWRTTPRSRATRHPLIRYSATFGDQPRPINAINNRIVDILAQCPQALAWRATRAPHTGISIYSAANRGRL